MATVNGYTPDGVIESLATNTRVRERPWDAYENGWVAQRYMKRWRDTGAAGIAYVFQIVNFTADGYTGGAPYTGPLVDSGYWQIR